MVSNSIRLPRLSGLQRIIVLLVAVTGIVVGLLAMHTLTTVTGDHTAHHIAAASHQHTTSVSTDADMAHAATMAGTADTGMAHGVPDCNGSCESGHNMANMVCLLALLVLTLTLTLRVIITRWGNDLHRLVAALAAALPATQAAAAPPSLHVLSISRT